MLVPSFVRPGNLAIADRLPADWGEGYPTLWLGVSVENKRFLTRMDTLRKIPAVIRFVSAEPLLQDSHARALAAH